MSYIAYCFDGIARSCRNCMVTPITKQKAMVFGGIVLFVMLFIIVLVLALPSTYSTDQTGSTVLSDYPVALGRSSLSYYLKTNLTNQFDTSDLSSYKTLVNMTYIGIQIWTVGSSNCSTADYKDAMPQIMDQIDAVERFTDLTDASFVLANGVAELNQALYNGKRAGLFALDGGYAIGIRISALRTYYNLGVRIMALGGPTTTATNTTCSTKWSQTADGNATIGLTDFGKAVVGEMNRLGIAIDLSGSSNTTINETLGNSTAPVLFTSAGAMNITSDNNNLSDDQLKKIKARENDLIMISFDKSQLCANLNNCSISHLIETINYIADIVGRENVALGGGGLTNEDNYPEGVNTASGLVSLFDYLHNQTNSWSLEELQNLSQGNFLTFITNVEASAKDLANASPSQLFESDTELGEETSYSCITDWSIFYGNSQTSSSTTVAPSAATTVTTSAANTVTTTVAPVTAKTMTVASTASP